MAKEERFVNFWFEIGEIIAKTFSDDFDSEDWEKAKKEALENWRE